MRAKKAFGDAKAGDGTIFSWLETLTKWWLFNLAWFNLRHRMGLQGNGWHSIVSKRTWRSGWGSWRYSYRKPSTPQSGWCWQASRSCRTVTRRTPARSGLKKRTQVDSKGLYRDISLLKSKRSTCFQWRKLYFINNESYQPVYFYRYASTSR